MLPEKIKTDLYMFQLLFENHLNSNNNFDTARISFVNKVIDKIKESIENFEDENKLIVNCIEIKSLLKDSIINNIYRGYNLEVLIDNVLTDLDVLITKIAEYKTIHNPKLYFVKIKNDLKSSDQTINKTTQYGVF